jgi:hypothetical protein
VGVSCGGSIGVAGPPLDYIFLGLSGGTWNSSGGFDGNGGYEFDGTGSDYLTLDYTPAITNDFTFSAWVKTNEPHDVNDTESDSVGVVLLDKNMYFILIMVVLPMLALVFQLE